MIPTSSPLAVLMVVIKTMSLVVITKNNAATNDNKLGIKTLFVGCHQDNLQSHQWDQTGMMIIWQFSVLSDEAHPFLWLLVGLGPDTHHISMMVADAPDHHQHCWLGCGYIVTKAILSIITLQCHILALVWLFGPANVTFWTCQCDFSALRLFPVSDTLPHDLKIYRNRLKIKRDNKNRFQLHK